MQVATNLEVLQSYLSGKNLEGGSPIIHPPAVGRTLGIQFTKLGPGGEVTMEMNADPALHGNPMGTVHGGILCDLADAAIGYTHWGSLERDESFTSVDLKINFFRPVWKEHLSATAKPIQRGRTVSFYSCDIVREDGKLVATVTSTVMTLRGDQAKGR